MLRVQSQYGRKSNKMTNVASTEARVQARMEKGAFGYIRGGAEDENNLRSNTESFDKNILCRAYYRALS